MGCNGEDTCTHSAGRVCIPESGQEQPGVYLPGGLPAGPVQVAKSIGQIEPAKLASGRLLQRSQGTSAKYKFILRYNRITSEELQCFII